MFEFNWEDLDKKSTREVLNGLMNGKYPLQDTRQKIKVVFKINLIILVAVYNFCVFT